MRIAIIGDIQNEKAEVVVKNLGKLFYYTSRLIARGHHPFCPAWLAMQGMFVTAIDGLTSIGYGEYMEYSKSYISVCDAVLVTGYGNGSKDETDYAIKLGKLIYYDIDDIPDQKEGL